MWNRPPGISPRFIIGAQYFVYFGVLGMFLPYFNLYLYHIGFSGIQIGTLSALRSITLVLFSLLWSLLADRYLARRQIYIGCTFISTGIWGFYLLTTDFRMMLLVTLFYGAFYAPIISFLEAFTLETLGKTKDRYGRIRAWGSISFIVIVILLGPVVDFFSADIILVTILAGSIIFSFFSLNIPTAAVRGGNVRTPGVRALMKPRSLFFLFSAFLMLVSHGTYYGFFSIHLTTLGYDKTFIGIAWALASTAEILVMIRSDTIFRRFSIENVLVCSFLAAALRWGSLFFIVSPLGILATQLLHAVTYGTFHMASILYIDALAPGEAKTTGQAVNNAVTYGLGLMVGFFFNGWLYESLGSHTLFTVSGFIALAGGLMFGLSAYFTRSGTNHSFFR